MHSVQFVRALTAYLSYELILLPPAAKTGLEGLQDLGALAENPARIRMVTANDLAHIPKDLDLVLLTTGWAVDKASSYRGQDRKVNRPVTGLIHSMCNPSQLPFIAMLSLLALRPYDALVCSSRAGRTALHQMCSFIDEQLEKVGLPSRPACFKTPLIPLGIEVSEWAVELQEASPVNVLHFGRLSDKSKADLRPLLLVWAKLKRRGIKAVLTIAGDDTQSRLAADLTDYARQLGCDDSVQIIPDPTRQVKAALYRSAHICLSLSDNLQETFGVTILEAMASGKPIIASDWSGYRDLVEHGRNGFLIPSRFPWLEGHDDRCYTGVMLSDCFAPITALDLESLTRSLERLCVDADLRKAMGRESRRRAVETYDWRLIVAKYEMLWEELKDEAKKSKASLVEECNGELTSWNPMELFGHYASEKWYKTQLLTLNDDADAIMEERARSQKGPSGHKAMEERIVQLLAGGNMSLESLAGALKIEAPAIVPHLGRLCKYGVLAWEVGHAGNYSGRR